MADDNNRINKARYWWAVLWIENLIPNWEDEIADLIQLPFAYCVHRADLDTKKEHRKEHLHLIIAFSNTTTYKHALSVFRLLGEKAVNTCQAVIDIRHTYEYLIHNTNQCVKDGKHLYDPDERVTGNNFDIGLYEQISTADKEQIQYDLMNDCLNYGFENTTDLICFIQKNYEDDYRYIKVFMDRSAFFERITRGNYLKNNNPAIKNKEKLND